MSEDDDYISRSQLKREAEEAQRLGEQLSALNDAELDALGLPEVLATAIRDARTIRQHGALRRQRQYIGKLMRKVDIAPIRAALAEKERNRRREAGAFKGLETWRERLINEGDSALAAWLADHPDSDAVRLRTLVDAARNAPTPAARKTAARALFRYLSERARMHAN
jgi:ribosome-associated protein